MTKKCIGCGAILQVEDITKDGYVRKENYDISTLCERCFKIRNYGEYKTVEKTNQDFFPILESINKTNDLVVLVVDLFNISNELELLKKYISNKALLVLTKRDILPLSVYDEKLKEYFKNIENHPNYGTGIKVVQLTVSNQFVCEYKNAPDAERCTGIDKSSIRRCCVGKQKTAGGFKWMNKKEWEGIQSAKNINGKN